MCVSHEALVLSTLQLLAPVDGVLYVYHKQQSFCKVAAVACVGGQLSRFTSKFSA